MTRFLDRFKTKKKKFTREGVEIMSFDEWRKDLKPTLKEINKPLSVTEWWDKSKDMPEPSLTQRIKEVVIKPPVEPESTARAETKTPSKLKSILRRLKGDG